MTGKLDIDELAASIDHADLKTFYAAVRIIIDNLTDVKRQLGAELEEEIGSESEAVSINGTVVGTLVKSKDSVGAYGVVDADAFAQWCLDNGYENLVEQRNVLTKAAMDEGFIRGLVERFTGGEMPAGVDYKPGHAGSLKFTVDRKTAYSTPIPLSAIPHADQLLGIEAPKEESF